MLKVARAHIPPRFLPRLRSPQPCLPISIANRTRVLSTAATATLGDPATSHTRVSRANANAIPPASVPWRQHHSQDAATPTVFTFFEPATSTWQYLVVDPKTSEAVIVDPVLDYDPASGAVTTSTADGLVSFIEHNALKVSKILETHAHADHLTAAQYLKHQLPGDIPVCIGQRIRQVQNTFAPVYGIDPPSLENAFDIYLGDNEEFALGSLSCRVMHLPGHTPDHVGFVIGKAVFAGDSIFNPDVGSARADFPGGNAELLCASIQRLLSLPEDYRLYVGHDYPKDRDQVCFSTVADQRAKNMHVKSGVDSPAFIQFRKARDAVLGAPRLLHPALQVNIRAGRLPSPDKEGRIFMRIPVRTGFRLD